MSRSTTRIPPASRLLVLAGAAAILAQNFVPDPTLKAALQLGGGAVSLAGVAWLLFSLRRGT